MSKHQRVPASHGKEHEPDSANSGDPTAKNSAANEATRQRAENPETGYGDPLTPETRVERRYLLATDMVLVAFVWASMVPTKIEALGLQFGGSERYALLGILFAINLYYLVAFWLYARVDERAWLLKYADAQARMFEAYSKPDPNSHGYEMSYGGPPVERKFEQDVFFRAWQMSQRVYHHRRWFDIRFPSVFTIAVWVACIARIVKQGHP